MKQKMTFILWLLPLIFCFSCGQKREGSDNFIELLNHYQKDSLQNILASDFQLTRTYTSYKNDVNSFLGEYLEKSKAFNGKYNIIETISLNEPKSFLIEDESDYLKYLKVESPKWKITIKRNVDNKVEQVIFDTTSTFEKYKLQIWSKEEIFSNWLAKNHPEESLEELHKNNKLLFERLQSFSNQK